MQWSEHQVPSLSYHVILFLFSYLMRKYIYQPLFVSGRAKIAYFMRFPSAPKIDSKVYLYTLCSSQNNFNSSQQCN